MYFTYQVAVYDRMRFARPKDTIYRDLEADGIIEYYSVLWVILQSYHLFGLFVALLGAAILVDATTTSRTCTVVCVGCFCCPLPLLFIITMFLWNWYCAAEDMQCNLVQDSLHPPDAPPNASGEESFVLDGVYVGNVAFFVWCIVIASILAFCISAELKDLATRGRRVARKAKQGAARVFRKKPSTKTSDNEGDTQLPTTQDKPNTKVAEARFNPNLVSSVFAHRLAKKQSSTFQQM
jgi:hypothetical protein